MRPLRVLMAIWDKNAEEFFRQGFKESGHSLTFMNPWRREEEFIKEVKRGEYDVILLTNLGLPGDLAVRLIAPCRQADDANVIVMSTYIDENIRAGALREGAVGYYPLPLPYKDILGALEAAAEGAVIIKR